jgi:RNA polymerase sigma-70 factor (sigma-E family)
VPVSREGFDDWLAAVAPRLHRTAFLLTGDWALAQDLVQDACAVTWSKWPSIKPAAAEAFTRTVMARAASARWRRRWRGELPHAVLPEQAGSDPWAHVDRRESLRVALLALPPRQRAVLVLRFYDDLSEADTAAALGCALGTVKSAAARGLAALRASGLTADLEVL